MVSCPLGALLRCPCNYPSGTWGQLLWEKDSPQYYPSGEWKAVSCGSMRLQHSCFCNYPSERRMVERGGSYLPFLRYSGSLQVSLVSVLRQPPRLPSRETPFSLQNDPSEAKEGG